MRKLSRPLRWMLVIVLLVSQNAMACGVCMDEDIRTWLPFVDKLMILCLLWIVAVVIVKTRRRQSEEGIPDRGRGRRQLFGTVLVGAVGTFIIMYVLAVQQPEPYVLLMISPIYEGMAYAGINPFWSLPAFLVIWSVGVAITARLDPDDPCSSCRAAAWRAARDMIVVLLFLGGVAAGIIYVLQCPAKGRPIVLAELVVLCELLLALLLIRRRSHRREGIPWRVVIGAALLSTIGLSIMCCLAYMSVLTPSLLIGIVWAVYVTRKVIEAARRRPCQQEARALLRVNAAFLALAILCVPGSYAYARSVRGMIGRLGASRSTDDYLRRELIARAESSVKPIIGVTRRAIRRYDGTEDSEWARSRALSSAFHCLGEIGGSEAEAFLAAVVRGDAGLANAGKLHVYPEACIAYAKCAGGRAVADLIAAYRRTDDDVARAAILAALVRTADKDAIPYVLSHMDVLLENDGYGYDHEREVQLARRAIVYGAGIADLKNPENIQPKGGLGSPETAWRERKTEIWEKWERVFE
ncbi:MAG: hypothetical protein AB1696_02480 [Planctomycetota bacterium]